METQREAKRAGRYLRRRGRSGGDYAGGRIRRFMPAAVIGSNRRDCLLPDGGHAKARLGYDDSRCLRVMALAGPLARSLQEFSLPAVVTYFSDTNGNVLVSGLLEGNANQLVNQLVGVSIAWVLGIVGTVAILFVVDKSVGLRVSPEHENQGLDLSQHGEEGYNWEAS